MKILTFTDTHGSKQALRRLKNKVRVEKPDLIVCAGDISMFETGIASLLQIINKFPKPVVMIHGNHESEETFRAKKFKNISYIHNSSYSFGDYLFVGYGGGGFSVIDPHFEKIGKKLDTIIKNNKGKKIVLVSHGPPYKTKLDKINGDYSGSKPLKKFIEKHNIELVLCGHIHENSGKQDFVGKARVVNPGPKGKILIV